MSTATNATMSQITSLSELWNTFLQKYSSGTSLAGHTTPKLSGARLDYARREWVTQVKQQVNQGGCQRFCWPATPEEVGALNDALQWDVAELWREVNAFFSISAQGPNKRPDPGNTSYKTWQAENQEHEKYRKPVLATPVQTKARQDPVAGPSRQTKGSDPDHPDPDWKKPQSDNDEEDLSKDKPFTVLSPRLYGFTPKWFHKIWTLDETDSRLKAFALKKWISLMREFHAISKDYGEQTVLQMLNQVRSQESAEKIFTRWDNYLQQLAARLYEDWEEAVRQWPKGDDDADEAEAPNSTQGNNTDTVATQTPTPALTPVQELKVPKEPNSLPLRQRRFVVVLSEDGVPVSETNDQARHDRLSKRKRRKSPSPVYPKRRARADSETETGKESSTEEEIVYNRRSVDQHNRVAAHRNQRTAGQTFQVVEEKRERQYSEANDNESPPFIETAPKTRYPFVSGQRRPNQAPRGGIGSYPEANPISMLNPISSRQPPRRLATIPPVRPGLSHPPTTKPVGLTNQRPIAGIPRHTVENPTKGHSDRRAAGPNVVVAPGLMEVESDDGYSTEGASLDTGLAAKIEKIYADVKERNRIAFEEQERQMEEGRLRGLWSNTVGGEDSLEDTVSSFESRSDDDMESLTGPANSWGIPATWVEENARNLEARRPKFRSPNATGMFETGSSRQKTKEKTVQWDNRPVKVRFYTKME